MALVRVERKIFGLQLCGGVGDGHAVQQHRAEDRDLGLDGRRQAVSGSGHYKGGHAF
jgi:hypothetical protein